MEKSRPSQDPVSLVYERFRRTLVGMDPLDISTAIHSGKWPEGTPQDFISIQTHSTPSERLLLSMGHVSITPERVEQIRTRTPEEVARANDEEARRHPIPPESSPRESVEDMLSGFGLNSNEIEIFRKQYGLDDGFNRSQGEIAFETRQPLSEVERAQKRTIMKLRSPKPGEK